MNSQVRTEGEVTVPMQTVTRRPISTAGPGPYYVYLPGFTVHDLARMTRAFSSIPAGEVFRISSAEDWYEKRLIGDELAPKEEITITDFFGHTKGVLRSIEIPAKTICDSLFADRALTGHGLVKIDSFDTLDVAHESFNALIQPVKISDLGTPPAELRDRIQKDGMLKLRRRWLEEAAEALASGRMLEDYRRVIDARPMLRDLWLDAIIQVLLPAVDGFEITANTILAQKEEAIRSGQKAVYDTYDHILMWLLARKPERTALSRTLEGANAKGVGIEEIRTLVQEVVGATSANGSRAMEQMQCVDCGELVNMVAGGPPRKCRFCGYEFYSAGVAAAAAADATFGSVESNGDAAVDPTLDQLADTIMAQKGR